MFKKAKHFGMATLMAVAVAQNTAWTMGSEELSLSDLLNLEVDAGNLTGLKGNKVPVPITVITKEDIAKTPYRNMVDLMEAYVPGLFQLSHQVPVVGMRGVVVDRNYKWLLLVNGRVMNQRGAEGAIEEIRHYTLDDIERIEVIRGPGSVTYGPGAISGVVNVVTKTGETTQGFEVTAGYDHEYYMRSLGVGYGFTAGPVKGYAYAGGQYQDGAETDYYRVRTTKSQAAYGVMGEDIDETWEMQNYLGSVQDEPFLKLHLDLTAFDNWRLWARYTQANGPQMVSSMNLVDYSKFGVYDIPTRFTSYKTLTGVLENKQPLNDVMTMTTMASFKSHDYILSAQRDTTKDFDYGIADFNKTDPRNGNTVYSFAEHEGFFKGLLNADFSDQYKAALGGSFSFMSFTPRWGGEFDKTVFQPKTGTTNNGELYADLEQYGYGTMMGSVFGEANLGFHPLATALLSMRVDKHQWSEPFYSPRIGVISELDPSNVVKLFWQRSVRMNVTSDMFREYVNGADSKPEVLNSVELSYITSPLENVSGALFGFYNTMEVLGWNGSTNQTEAVGDLEYWGAEAEVKYETPQYKVGLNHAMVSLIDWKNAEGVKFQGISTSDYDRIVDSLHTLESTGNSLNNVPEQLTKVFATVNLPFNTWAHTNFGIQWGYQGFKDAQKMYDKMHNGTDSSWTAVSEALDDADYGGMELRWNMSVGYDFPTETVQGGVMLYAQNLLGQKTHTYSSGNRQLYPDKMQWIEEPTTFGVRLNLRY